MRIKLFTLLITGLFIIFPVFASPESTILEEVARTQGFFFFYSSACSHCQQFAPRLKRVSQRFGFKVVAISIDGGFLSSFPDAKMDEGQKTKFGVSVLPSLFLVNPKTESGYLITEGAINEGELIRRLVKVVHLQSKKEQTL